MSTTSGGKEAATSVTATPASKKGSVTETLSDLLECSVCLESLDLHHKVLPCQHTFCLSCLEDVIAKNKKSGGNQVDKAGVLFLCPECRYEVTTQVSSLPTNVILNRILSGLQTTTQQTTTSSTTSATPQNLGISSTTTVPNEDDLGKKNSFSQIKKAPPAPLAIGDHRKLPLPKSLTVDNNNIPGNWATNPFLASSTPPESPLPLLPPKLAPVTAPPLPARPSTTQNTTTTTTPAQGSQPSQIYRALYDYKPVKPDELELKKDELYFVIEKCQDGWFKGSSLTTLKTGVFPGNYVMHVQDEKKISNSSSSDLIDFTSDIMDVFGATKQKALKNKRKSEDVQVKTNQEKHLQAKTILYRAIMPFPSSSQYELELKQGDVVVMSRIREDGWCKGTLQRSGQTGLFPLSFVEKIS